MKRFFTCFILIILIFALYNNKVYATDIIINNNTYSLPDEIVNKKYVIVFKFNYNNDCYVRVLASDYDVHYEVINSIPFILIDDNRKDLYTITVYKTEDYYKISDFSFYITSSGINGYELSNSENLFYSNFDLKDKDGKIVFEKNETKFKNPQIQNKDKLEKLDFDNILIYLNDYDSKERLYLHRLEVSTTVDLGEGNTVYYYNDKVFGLDFFTSYYNNDPDHPGYIIPKYQFELENNKIYYFLLSSSATSISNSYNLIDDYTKIEDAFDGVGISTSDSFTYEQQQQEQQKKQNDQLEENNKTNKNIFETIKEILSYLNPFSENFFAYKLVELILNGIKSLFVPSDDFFSNFFTDLKQWFSDRFGLLFYPFDLIIDVLNRITNINLSEPKFNIPEIKEPSTGKTLFKAQNYNFNDLLATKEFKTMHDIYFVIVDAIIIFAFANLIKNKLKEVETQ